MDIAGGRFRLSGAPGAVASWLPRGGGLDADTWAARHRGICALLWIHVLALPLIAIAQGQTVLHGLAEGGVVAWLALAAALPGVGPRIRAASATLGLMASSAAVVHLYDGVIETHFHFFVMVAVVALYQSWLPYLLALAFVVLHHSLVGTLAPHAVYNHEAAISHPWLWGLVHGAFILAESAACLVYWRASEAAVSRERAVRISAERARQDLTHAQALSGIGSWEWDVTTDTVSWSDHLFDLTGVDKGTYVPSVDAFLELVHPDDRERIAHLIGNSLGGGPKLDFECRLARADGEVLAIHALGDVLRDENGSVVRMRGTLHDVTERKRLQDVITQMAFHDPLTGLANRRLYLERLDEALSSGGDNETCAVLFIDLDGFKAVNDHYGHAVGDALLQEIAVRLKSSVRETDTVARFGGDEFAILCEGGDHEVARLTARRIEEQLGRATLVDGRAVVVAASIGIAVAEAGATADGLLRRADAAMYEVKTLARQPRASSRDRAEESSTIAQV